MKMDPKEEQMFITCDERDDKIQKEIDEKNEANQKEGFFGRLMAWNNPVYLIIALFASLLVGSSQPVFGGLLLSKVLTQLTVTAEQYA